MVPKGRGAAKAGKTLGYQASTSASSASQAGTSPGSRKRTQPSVTGSSALESGAPRTTRYSKFWVKIGPTDPRTVGAASANDGSEGCAGERSNATSRVLPKLKTAWAATLSPWTSWEVTVLRALPSRRGVAFTRAGPTITAAGSSAVRV